MKGIKKKFMSRIMAVCLMLVMVLSTGMAVSAAQLTSESTASITISGIETDDSGDGIGTLNAYRVINVNVNNNQPQAPVYKWDTAVAEWVNQNFSSYIDVDNSNAVTNTFLNLSDDSSELKAFVDQLANAIRKATITLSQDTIHTILDSQYEQYKQAQRTVDLINFRYHDLKNHIIALRAEEDAPQRHEYLDKLEHEIHDYEAMNKTGNHQINTSRLNDLQKKRF